MSNVKTEASEIIWMSNDGKEAITKMGESYHLRDRAGALIMMGNSLDMLKENLEQLGRSDIIKELVDKHILE